MFEDTFFNLLYIVTTLPQIILIIYVIGLKPGRTPADFGLHRFRGSDIPQALLTAAGIMVLTIPIGFAASAAFPDTGNSLIYGNTWEFGRLGLAPLVLLSCIVTGYIEEIFFRSYLVVSLQKAGTGFITSVALSTLLFSAGHLYEGLYAFVLTAVLGVFLAFMFYKTKSIHAVAIGHGLYNFTVLMISMMEGV